MKSSSANGKRESGSYYNSGVGGRQVSEGVGRGVTSAENNIFKSGPNPATKEYVYTVNEDTGGRKPFRIEDYGFNYTNIRDGKASPAFSDGTSSLAQQDAARKATALAFTYRPESTTVESSPEGTTRFKVRDSTTSRQSSSSARETFFTEIKPTTYTLPSAGKTTDVKETFMNEKTMSSEISKREKVYQTRLTSSPIPDKVKETEIGSPTGPYGSSRYTSNYNNRYNQQSQSQSQQQRKSYASESPSPKPPSTTPDVGGRQSRNSRLDSSSSSSVSSESSLDEYAEEDGGSYIGGPSPVKESMNTTSTTTTTIGSNRYFPSTKTTTTTTTPSSSKPPISTKPSYATTTTSSSNQTYRPGSLTESYKLRDANNYTKASTLSSNLTSTSSPTKPLTSTKSPTSPTGGDYSSYLTSTNLQTGKDISPISSAPRITHASRKRVITKSDGSVEETEEVVEPSSPYHSLTAAASKPVIVGVVPTTTTSTTSNNKLSLIDSVFSFSFFYFYDFFIFSLDLLSHSPPIFLICTQILLFNSFSILSFII